MKKKSKNKAAKNLATAGELKESLLEQIEEKARNHDYDIAFLLEWTKNFTREINTCIPAELTRGLSAIAKLEYFDESFLEEINYKINQDLNNFSIYEISHCFRGFAKLGYYSEEFIEQSKQIFYVSKDQASPEDLSNIIWGMSKLKHHDEEFFTQWSEKAIENMDSFRSIELSKTALSVAKLGYYSKEFVDKLMAQVNLKRHSFDKQGLSNSAFALTMLMKNNDLPEGQKEAIKNLIIVLVQRINPEQVTKTEEKRQLISIFYAMDDAAREELPHIRDSLDVWDGEVKKDSIISTSPIQSKIFNFVKTQDKEAKEEHWIREIGSYVDIYVPSANSIFQVDGKTHFYANDNVQDAITRFNSAMVSQHATLSRITNFYDYERDIKRTLKEARTTQHKAVEPKKQTATMSPLSSNPFSSLEVEEMGDIVDTLKSASVSIAAPKTSQRDLRKEKDEKTKVLEADEKAFIDQAIEDNRQALAEFEREERAKKLNKTLVERYIENNKEKLRNKTPLMLATEQRSAQWVKRILQEGFTPKEAKAALDVSFRNKDLNVIQEFLNYDIPIGSSSSRERDCQRLAIYSIIHDYPRGLQSLLSRRLVNPNFEIENPNFKPENYNNKISNVLTPLILACGKEKLEAVEILLNAGAKPNKLISGCSPLYIACMRDNPEVAQLLLENGAKPNVATPDMSTPLLSASRNNNKETIKLLLKWGANPNVVDNSGQSVLLLAARDGNTELVDAIIEARKVDLNIISREADRMTPLMAATQANHIEIVEALVNAAAEMEIKNRFGQTALSIAAQRSPQEIVRTLLNKFADPEAARDDKTTPLMIAIGNNRLDIVKDLLAAGANINGGSPHSAKEHSEDLSKEGGASLIIYEEIKKFERDPVEYIVEYDQPIELKLKALDRLSKQEITPEITAKINRQKDILELASQAQNAVAEMSSTRAAPSTQAKAAGKGMGR